MLQLLLLLLLASWRSGLALDPAGGRRAVEVVGSAVAPAARAGAAAVGATVAAVVALLFLRPEKRVWHLVMRAGIHDHVSLFSRTQDRSCSLTAGRSCRRRSNLRQTRACAPRLSPLRKMARREASLEEYRAREKKV